MQSEAAHWLGLPATMALLFFYCIDICIDPSLFPLSLTLVRLSPAIHITTSLSQLDTAGSKNWTESPFWLIDLFLVLRHILLELEIDILHYI